MNITSEVKIANYIYNIIQTVEKLILEGRECRGIIDYHYHNIKINIENIDIQGQEETLIHEIIHAIDIDRKLNLTEEQVEGLGCGIHQVIKDNKDIFMDKFD